MTGTDTAATLSAAPPLTLLYVPGDHPDRVAKALASEADVVIVDLEDAVAAPAKSAARAWTAELLDRVPPTPVQVRINDPRTPEGRADIVALAGRPGVIDVRLPKVEDPATVAETAAELPGVRLHLLLETAIGIERAFELATAHPAVAGIALGEADLRADLGITDESGLIWARSRAVIAARAAGLPAPQQSVYTRFRDLAGLAESCREGRALGFVGRTAIHPAQLPVIAEAYRPSAAEIAAAEEVMAAVATAERDGGGGRALPDGRVIDPAAVGAARRVLGLVGRME
ncbi:HpcH/HpaI aldolase/citrate lyase family protein [Nocardiopsis sediminis]|uniref:HpcH/HpaI aldolase/citrate lyase family protein n=1 Tax=Nocardiopsis sediminis TaxID=1778267 RepID=A0ABV8FNJ5_9ACTN